MNVYFKDFPHIFVVVFYQLSLYSNQYTYAIYIYYYIQTNQKTTNFKKNGINQIVLKTKSIGVFQSR